MIADKFSISHFLIFSIIVFNIISVIRIPGISYSEKFNYILQIFIFLLVLYVELDLKDFIRLKKNIFSFSTIIGIFIILFFLFTNLVVNFQNNLEIFSILKLISFPVIIIFFYIKFPQIFIKNDILFEKFLNYWLLFSIPSIIISLIVLLLGLEIFQYSTHSTVGFFYYTNIFAFIFTFTIPILIYKYFTKKLQIIPFIILLFSSFVCLLFTFSRAGYIGALVSILIMIYKRSRILFFTSIIFIILISSTIVLQFASAKGTASALSRAQVMYIGYDMIFNNGINKFLWGYGIFNSKRIFVQELTSTFSVTREETGPHNFILTLGIQFGMLLTFTVIIYLILIIIKSTLKIKRKINDLIYFKINLSIAITSGILVQCLLEDIVVYPEFFVMPLFLIFLGILNFYNKTQ